MTMVHVIHDNHKPNEFHNNCTRKREREREKKIKIEVDHDDECSRFVEQEQGYIICLEDDRQTSCSTHINYFALNIVNGSFILIGIEMIVGFHL